MSHRWIFALSLLVLMMLVQPARAQPLACEKIVISGEAGWPPFSYIEDGQLTGVGVELARVLFTQLNIPVEVRTTQNQSELEHFLRRGQVDLLVGTYDLPKYDQYTRLVIPPYYEDTLAIVVTRQSGFEFSDWHHLMGHTGITTKNRQLGKEFIEFSRAYLNVQPMGDLRLNFRKLALGEFEYIIGSAQLLKAGMNKYAQGQFEFLPVLVSAENVHFAFSEQSPCKAYAPFLRASLNALTESQLIFNLVQKHVKQDS